MRQIIALPSPNFSDRNAEISMIVLHYTGMKTAQEALDRLCNTQAQVSAHYVVDEDGTIYHLVDEKYCAWHAGVSFWRGNKNINPISIGIEIVNPGHEFGYRAFPAIQMQAVAELCRDILTRHVIFPQNIVGHSDVAPSRKEDPGELFDWKYLAENGIGMWPGQVLEKAISRGYAEEFLTATPHSEGVSVSEGGNRLPPFNIKEALSNYGYDTSDLTKTIIAFQRHFRASVIDGNWDAECQQIINRLNQG